MTIRVKKSRQANLQNIVRHLGYKPLGFTEKGELNAVRSLGGDYPRFHAYIKEEGDEYIFNVHLDQKRPTYGNETAHSGDYDGEVVRDEAAHIRSFIMSIES